MLSTYTSKLPSNFSREALTTFFKGDNPERWLEAREQEFYIVSGANGFKDAQDKIDRLNREVERVRSKWACISAKSQRAPESETGGRFSNTGYFEVKTFDNLTTIRPKYERMKPISAGRDAGETVHTFSKRSRQRMLNKARKLNKNGLPIPYFVTLTYHRNMKNFKRAKKDLNAFLQRWRRVNSDFRYFWKMEPQKRGAIHFHLAWFEPSGFFPDAWDDYAKENPGAETNIYVEYVRMRIGAAWNEIAEPGDNQHLQAGTNVRSVDNWRMFTAYVGKYMKKEIGENPWGNGKTYVKRREIVNFKGTKAVRECYVDSVRYAHVDWWKKSLDSMLIECEERRTGALHTGRWWGFSNNFDFEAIQAGAVDSYELDNLNDFCNTLNTFTFQSITAQLIDNAKRAKESLKGKSLEARLNKLRNTYEAQKKRYEINKEKIKRGYSLQFEVNQKKALRCWRYLRAIKQKECPFLIHYYSLHSQSNK